MQLEEAVESYLEEWVKGLPPPNATHDWYREALQSSHATIDIKGSWNVINQKGNKHLWAAARLLLQEAGEQRRVRLKTARRCLVEAHSAHLPKVKRTGRLSEHAVIAGATKRLTECARSGGFYVIPVQFAPSAKSTRFRIGPAVILAKAMFEAGLPDDGRHTSRWHR
jgi:hypothetical protein